MDLVTIDRFTNSSAATVARATLEAAGIEAFLADEIDAHAHGGIRLQVAREEVSAALDLLREAHASAVDDELDDELDDAFDDERPPLDPTDLFCRRCGSEEVYPLTDRARAYARALVLSIFGGVLVQVVAWLAHAAEVQIPPRALSGALIVLLAAPLVTALAFNLAPRMQCRNCRLEWRGRQWTT
jgi:hypothetical protein